MSLFKTVTNRLTKKATIWYSERKRKGKVGEKRTKDDDDDDDNDEEDDEDDILDIEG